MEKLLEEMAEQGDIIRYASGDKRMIASVERMARMKDGILSELSRFHAERPLAEGANHSKVRIDPERGSIPKREYHKADLASDGFQRE